MSALPPIYPDRTRRDWTVEALRALPDDGQRYEVVDGELLVSPSPSLVHQDAVGELFVLLRSHARRNDLHCIIAPAEVRFSPNRVVQPDVFVVPFIGGRKPARLDDVHRLILAVEVLSPSSARADRHSKRHLYQSQSVPEYWIVDPANRFVERWRPGDDAPEVLLDSLTWTPREGGEPLVIDLAAYLRRVHGEDGGAG
ncbi:MAG: Uma2 family endonuclease [Gemmatimonadetes bacterium]|nr:Uma2 family endonuclease [Gemmatimonadota bacterium]